ncbi:hypothetical protein BVX99_00670 [bacterium F16]|nr:hypothetical protein BVX99_00670 [bacterium F16]
MKPRVAFSRFTIIEIIVVILIALIIVSLTAGTIMNAGDGMRLDSSSRLVGSVLMRARQEAIARRRLIAVLMPGKNADIENSKKYSAIRLAYVTKDESTTPTTYIFDEFPDDTTWGFVQPGIAIMEADDDCGIMDILHILR